MRDLDTEAETDRIMAYDERDRDWSDAVASQGMPMIDGNH